MEFINVNLEEGLRRLLQHRNTTFLYRKAAGGLSIIYMLGRHGDHAAQAFFRRSGIPSSTLEPVIDSDDENSSEANLEADWRKISLKIETLEETLQTTLMVDS